MKVYLDEDLSPIVAQILREKGVDAVSAHEVGNVQLDDRAQLTEATRDGRAIVTANVVDFLALTTRSRGTRSTRGSFWSLPACGGTNSRRLGTPYTER